MTGQEKIDH